MIPHQSRTLVANSSAGHGFVMVDSLDSIGKESPLPQEAANCTGKGHDEGKTEKENATKQREEETAGSSRDSNDD
jgi:hypothetical protein